MRVYLPLSLWQPEVSTSMVIATNRQRLRVTFSHGVSICIGFWMDEVLGKDAEGNTRCFYCNLVNWVNNKSWQGFRGESVETCFVGGSWAPWVKSWVRLLVAVELEAFPIRDQQTVQKKRQTRDVNTVNNCWCWPFSNWPLWLSSWRTSLKQTDGDLLRGGLASRKQQTEAATAILSIWTLFIHINLMYVQTFLLADICFILLASRFYKTQIYSAKLYLSDRRRRFTVMLVSFMLTSSYSQWPSMLMSYLAFVILVLCVSMLTFAIYQFQ